MGKLFVYPVPLDQLHNALPGASAYIQKCAAITDGAKTYAYFVSKISSGEWLMWLVFDEDQLKAVSGTTIYTRPDGKLGLDITFLGGDGIATWVEELVSAITNYARENKVFAMVATARPGMKVALPGWKVRAWEFYKECDDGNGNQ